MGGPGPVSTSTPNLVEIPQRAAELWRFMFFSRWRTAAILDFCGSKIWRYFCFRHVGFSIWGKFCTNMCNCDRVMAVLLNFQNGGRRHLGFLGSEIWRHRKSRAARIYLLTKFGEDISKGGRVMAIYVFSKWRSAAILDFCRIEIWRYFCLWDVGFSLWAKFCANMCNFDRVIAV